MRRYRKTRRVRRIRHRRTMKGGDRSNEHRKLMSNISEQDYVTSLALIKQQILKLLNESERFFSTKQDKLIIEKEIDDLYKLGMKIREEKTGIQSLKHKRKNLYDMLYDMNNLDESQTTELKEIENKIKEIEKENNKRQQSYNTVVRLHDARKKHAQMMDIKRKSTVY